MFPVLSYAVMLNSKGPFVWFCKTVMVVYAMLFTMSIVMVLSRMPMVALLKGFGYI